MWDRSFLAQWFEFERQEYRIFLSMSTTLPAISPRLVILTEGKNTEFLVNRLFGQTPFQNRWSVQVARIRTVAKITSFANTGSEMKEDPVNIRSAASCYDIGIPIIQLNQASSRPYHESLIKMHDSVHSMNIDNSPDTT